MAIESDGGVAITLRRLAYCEADGVGPGVRCAIFGRLRVTYRDQRMDVGRFHGIPFIPHIVIRNYHGDDLPEGAFLTWTFRTLGSPACPCGAHEGPRLAMVETLGGAPGDRSSRRRSAAVHGHTLPSMLKGLLT